MATDYNAARHRPEDEQANDSLVGVQARRSATTQTAVIAGDDCDTAEGIDPPRAHLSHEAFALAVTPEQADEFICASCFLVRHRSQLAYQTGGASYCTDGEG